MPSTRILGAALLLLGVLVGAAGSSIYWQEQVALYQERLARAEGEVASLQDRVAADKSRIATLEAMLAQLEEENRALREKLQEANETIARLLEEKSILEARLQEANKTIQQLLEENRRLQEEIENLTIRVQQLEAENERLLQEIEALQAQLNATKLTVDDIFNLLRELAYWYDYYPLTYREDYYAHIDQVLQAAIETSPTPPTSDPVEAAVWTFNYAMENLQYYWDPYARVLLPGLQQPVPWPQVKMLPNETLAVGGGDCEDFAILAYGSLAQQAGPENVYLIYIVVPDGYGHAATLLRTPEGYIIVDPTGNYLNSEQALLIVGTLGFNPLTVDPQVRQALIDAGEAQLQLPTTTQPSQDLQQLLQEWLEDYWGFQAYTISIHTIGLHADGLTLTEAAETIESHSP